jgi:cell division transport system permease protein
MNILYAIKEGIGGFRRATFAAIGSIITITLSLLLVGLFAVISINTARLVEQVRERVEMEAFLTDPITQERIDDIQKHIALLNGVERVQFVSKDEAAQTFKSEFGEDINRVLDFNPLPPSFKIYLRDEYRTSERAEELQHQIKAINGVDDVVYRKEMLGFIDQQTQTLNYVGLALGILIPAKRKAIQTMKLGGATRWFVRAPFLVEGLLQGLIGGLIAAGIIYYLLATAAGLVSDQIADLMTIDARFYGLIVLAGIALGLFGSAISVRRNIGETI